jgi:hypothetical protein
MPEVVSDYYKEYGITNNRNSCWILSSESWMSQGAYIALPINPTQLSFDIGVRTTNEMTRATQLIYVWRFMGTKSTLVMPSIKITANSGYIVPSFNPDTIRKCQELVEQRTMSVNAQRATVRDLSRTEMALQREYEKLAAQEASNHRNYDQALQNYLAARPTPELTRDYIKGAVYKDIGSALQPNVRFTDNGLTGTGNLPDLYSENNKHIPIGIQNLYALYALADERRIRRTSESERTQTENRLMLVISTPVFPKLTLYGWFGESGISYSESADEPYSFDVNFDFIVTETVPRLGFGNWQSLINNYTENITPQVSTLAHARSMFPNGTKAQTPITGYARDATRGSYENTA